MKIIISIPAYNEADTLGKVIKDIRRVMEDTDREHQILVLDDGSKDDTALIAEEAGAKVHSHPMNYGLAETFKSEVGTCLRMGADVIVHIDADGQYRASDIPKLLEAIDQGYQLVLGSRFKGTIESMPVIKRWGNRAFSRTISHITRLPISDAQTGFRAFTREVAENITIISSHTYTQEQIIKAVRQKYRIKEVPVYFAKRKDKSRLIGNPFGYASRAWINLLRIYRDYEPLKFFGGVGSLIFGTGVLLGSYLAYIQFFADGVNRHMGLMILDIIILSIGIHLIIFGFLADMFRKG